MNRKSQSNDVASFIATVASVFTMPIITLPSPPPTRNTFAVYGENVRWYFNKAVSDTRSEIYYGM